jgi:tryptophan synthase alpha chain
MNRIDAAFERARREDRAALIVFLTGGDPDIETTQELVPELIEAGADIVEIGVPHSDPIGEGPTIQAASFRALSHGTTPTGILSMCRRIRSVSEAPLVLMGYFNNVAAMGEAAYVEACADAGVDGLIVNDVAYDGAPELQAACEARGVHRIMLVAPTSTPERVVRISRLSRGFVYCVAVTGVTGARDSLPADLGQLVAGIKRVATAPVAVGFGISTPEQAAQVAAFADGVIVGSALVSRIAQAGSRDQLIEAAAGFVRELSSGVRRARR